MKTFKFFQKPRISVTHDIAIKVLIDLIIKGIYVDGMTVKLSDYLNITIESFLEINNFDFFSNPFEVPMMYINYTIYGSRGTRSHKYTLTVDEYNQKFINSLDERV